MKRILPRHSATAFTLIELLVVVSIIVLLLSLLAPAMDQALDLAEITKCATQQDALVTACTMWAVERDRKLPGEPWRVPRGGNDPNYAADWIGNKGTFIGVVSGYTLERSHEMLYCPSQRDWWNEEKSWPDANADVAGRAFIWGYSYFAQYNSDNAAWASSLKSPSKISESGKIPIFGDTTRGILPVNDRFQGTPAQWTWLSHSRGGGSEGVASTAGGSTQVESDAYQPKGVNNGHLDGSVYFYRYDSRDSGELEYAVQLGTYPGFIWGKTTGSGQK